MRDRLSRSRPEKYIRYRSSSILSATGSIAWVVTHSCWPCGENIRPLLTHFIWLSLRRLQNHVPQLLDTLADFHCGDMFLMGVSEFRSFDHASKLRDLLSFQHAHETPIGVAL